ncbi:hypothetical protein Hanom_Chr09g00797781 [Helianthus anomalus]
MGPAYTGRCRVNPTSCRVNLTNKSFCHNRWSGGNSFEAVPLSSRSNNLSQNRGCNCECHGVFWHQNRLSEHRYKRNRCMNGYKPRR